MMHLEYGLNVTPAFRDGMIFISQMDTLLALDADLSDNKDEGVKDRPRPGDKQDILWTGKLQAKRHVTDPLFYKDWIILSTLSDIEFFEIRPKGKELENIAPTRVIPCDGSYNGSPAHNDKILVVPTQNGVQAFDLENGKELWKNDGGSCTTACIIGERALYGDAGGTLHCVDIASGKDHWTAAVQCSGDCGPAVHGNVVYAASTGGKMNALSLETGELHWSWAVPDKLGGGGTQPGYESAVYTTPLALDGKLFFTSYSGYLYCLRTGGDESGGSAEAGDRLLWKHELGQAPMRTVPLAWNGALYIRGKGTIFKFVADSGKKSPGKPR